MQIVSVFNYLPYLEDLRGRASTVSRSFNLDTGWRSGITFTPCPVASGKRQKFRIREQNVSILEPVRRE